MDAGVAGLPGDVMSRIACYSHSDKFFCKSSQQSTSTNTKLDCIKVWDSVPPDQCPTWIVVSRTCMRYKAVTGEAELTRLRP